MQKHGERIAFPVTDDFYLPLPFLLTLGSLAHQCFFQRPRRSDRNVRSFRWITAAAAHKVACLGENDKKLVFRVFGVMRMILIQKFNERWSALKNISLCKLRLVRV
ncbi:MAG: hypothetical protein O3A00_25810, partial [Planctomycetota bacterium]|nr:hypothetical protein [Planctomycetota bacterium]